MELDNLSKNQLLVKLDEIDNGIIEFVASDDRSRAVTVPWSEVPVSALDALWGLKDHEIY